MRREWVEITIWSKREFNRNGLSPCGESGLKFSTGSKIISGIKSLSMRREWVEIYFSPTLGHAHGSLSMRREWVEIQSP